MDRGILFMLLASLSFALMGGFAKVVSQTLPPVEVTFFRNKARHRRHRGIGVSRHLK